MRRQSRSLLQTLWSRLRKKPDEPKPVEVVRPFPAISIYRGMKSCEMAKRFSEHRFLAKDAPTLPMSGCTMPKMCTCRYLKHKDRRTERRRFIEFGTAMRNYLGQDRRTRAEAQDD